MGVEIVDCVKPMNKSVVSNSIWITAGGGGRGGEEVFSVCNERGAGALQLHYLADNSHSTDGSVWLKKVSALVKQSPPTDPVRATLTGGVISDRHGDQACAFLPQSVALCLPISRGCVRAAPPSHADALMSTYIPLLVIPPWSEGIAWGEKSHLLLYENPI